MLLYVMDVKDDIYKQHILELSKSDKHMLGELKLTQDYVKCDYSNSSCGDKVTLYIKESNNTIDDIKIEIEGCAISRASVNIYIDNILGKSINDVRKLMPYDMHNMLGVKVSELRAPCALTGYSAMQKYLK